MRAHCSELFQAPDPRTYRPDLSEGFCQLLEAMLVKNRDYRLSSWADVCTMCLSVEQGVAFKPRQGTNSSIELFPPKVQAASAADIPAPVAATAAKSDGKSAPEAKSVPQPKQRVMHLFTGRKHKKREPQIQIDPESGKKILKKRKAANPGFKVHRPAEW